MGRVYRLLFILLFFPVVFSLAGQINPRVAGLENDEEYMDLLLQENKLHQIEDSLNRTVAEVRELFRSSPELREQLSEDIVRLEGEIFDVRNSIGVVSVKINNIEQDFIIRNLSSGNDVRQAVSTQNDSIAHGNTEEESYSNLIYNDFFKQNVSLPDYEALVAAQEKESSIIELLEKYRENYDTIIELAGSYQNADNFEDADSIYILYTELQEENSHISEMFSFSFSEIFENKTYAYNYLLDKLNKTTLLAEFDKKASVLRDEQAQMRGNVMSEAVSSYPLQKKLILEYEQTLAGLLGFKNALDSLSVAGNSLNREAFYFPKIELAERLFIDYEDVVITSPSRYNAQNPIPELKIYEKGIIYRILLGSFTRIQPVSVFRGAYPIGYIKGDDGKYRYYAGGLDTREKAIETLEILKKAGFRNPEVAEWNYGKYTIIDPSELTNVSGDFIYMIEIQSEESVLSEQVRQAIQAAAPGKDISKSGNIYIVGSFESEEDAEDVMDAIEEADENLEIKIVETEL